MTPDDCVHDDCCYCMALPKDAHPPPHLSRCEADRHVTGKTCHDGICRLVTVD